MKKLSLWPALLLVGFTLVSPRFRLRRARSNAEPAATGFPVWSLVPFLLMLVSIAVLPMAVPQWWDSNRNKTILSVAMVAACACCRISLQSAAAVAFPSGLRFIFDVIGLAVRYIRRYLHQRRVRRNAACQRDLSRNRGRFCEFDWNDRRIHAADSAFPARESFEAAPGSPDRLLHIHCQQHRGPVDAAR